MAGGRLKRWELVLAGVWWLLVPTQLGRHWWPEWSLIWGGRIDYLSPTLYVGDVFWLGWAAIYWWNRRERLKGKFSFEWLIVLLVVVLNMLVAERWQVAGWKWIRIGQGLLTGMIVAGSRREMLRLAKWIIPAWLVGEGWLALAQVIKGGSLQGWWWWLGERRFGLISVGVASMSWGGEQIVRAYGTFSHPNSLMGFLLVAMVFWVERWKKIGPFWRVVVVTMGSLGVILAGSRIGWLLWLGWGGWMLVRRVPTGRKRLGLGLVAVGVALVVGAGLVEHYTWQSLVGGWDKESWSKRRELMVFGVRMWRENWWLGVGANNAIVRLVEMGGKWWQPVHNLFVLVGAEIGVLGIMIIGWIWQRKVGFKTGANWWWMWLVLGLFDHYWWTLPQNWWLMVVLMAL